MKKDSLVLFFTMKLRYNETMMKRIQKIFMVVFALTLMACSATQESGFIDSDVQTILDKITLDETFIILIETDECYSCEQLRLDLADTVSAESLDIYVINTEDLSESDADQLSITIGDYPSWPTLFYILNGEVASNGVYEYSTNPEGWQSWLIEMGILNE